MAGSVERWPPTATIPDAHRLAGWGRVTTISHMAKPPPLILLKSLGYPWWSCCLFSVLSLHPLVKLLYFHFILNYQRHSDPPTLPSFSILLHKIIILLLWTDSSYYSFNLLSFTDGLKFSLHSKDICIIPFLQIAWEGIFPQDASIPTFPLKMHSLCLFLYSSYVLSWN